MFITFPRCRLRISVLALPAFLLLLWLEGLIPFAIMLASALFHELGHLFALKKCGRSPRRIDILPMGALIVCPEGIPDRDEAIIALFGPLFSLLLFVIFLPFYLLTQSPFFLFAALINLTLGLFNLLPIKKLDGGKALLCYLFSRTENKKAMRIANALSVTALALISALFAFAAALTSFNLGLCLLALALLLQLV